MNPRDATTLAVVALYYAKSDDPKRATEFIRKARTLDPADPALMYYEAVVPTLAGREGPAIAALEKALAAGILRGRPRVIRNSRCSPNRRSSASCSAVTRGSRRNGGWRLATGDWHSGWQLTAGGWQRPTHGAAGGWQLATGGWRLAAGNWQLAAGGWRRPFHGAAGGWRRPTPRAAGSQWPAGGPRKTAATFVMPPPQPAVVNVGPEPSGEPHLARRRIRRTAAATSPVPSSATLAGSGTTFAFMSTVVPLGNPTRSM